MKWSSCAALLLLVSLACADLIPIKVPAQSELPIGQSGNGTVWYQFQNSEGLTFKPITFGNVLNPINVSIVYDVGSINYKAHVCLNSFEYEFPISGANLDSACPAGGLGQASNSSTVVIPLPGKDVSTSSTSTPGAYTTQTVTAQVYVKPTSKGGLLVTIPDSVDLQTFRLSWFGKECSDGTYPLGTDNECIVLPTLSSATNSLDVGASQYFKYVVSEDLNAIQVKATGIKDGLKLFVQNGYYPTQDWFLNPLEQIDDDEGTVTATILSPVNGEEYFFLFYNSDKKDALSYTTTLSTSSCSDTQFGYNCTHDSSIAEPTPLNSYLRLSSSIVGVSPSAASVNNGTGWSYDYYDDDDSYPNEYAYFSLADYPQIPTPYYIRVSVGNNDASDLGGAPGFFAKRGGYPSAQSNHYNMSTFGEPAHQILIPITEADLVAQKNAPGGVLPASEAWFFAVQLPVDFSIWVGVNCAYNCSDGEHGVCYCNDVTCDSLSSQDFFYQRPISTLDSAGACTCSDDQYAKSYDCSSKGNGSSVMYLLLIAIAGAIILCVAVGVPLYCFVANRRANRERV